MAAADPKLERFCQWLLANGADLRGCTVGRCGGSSRGLGVFPSPSPPAADPDVLMVVPLHLAITPMRVLQDPSLGPACADLYQHSDVDDRFLLMLFLAAERLRPDSPWKPYLDVLPASFSTPLWFSDGDLSLLRGTPLHRATLLQKQSLRDLFHAKAEPLLSVVLRSSDVTFDDFLWANSVFWSRALNIPFPRSYVFPPGADGADAAQETVWAEGLVPGIDFCNHELAAAATWEVDATGFRTGVPVSMYLLAAPAGIRGGASSEVSINYGDKGNEELLYLYGFVLEDNKDDYLMLHYPVEAFRDLPSADSRAELLQAQKAEMRCLLQRSSLARGFFSGGDMGNAGGKDSGRISGYSWSGRRSVPSYLDKLVFPEEFLASLRTIAMSEVELCRVSSLLEELVGSDGERELSEVEVRSAVWEVCGDSGALQLLVDLLQARIMEMEEATGTAESDEELLKGFHAGNSADDSHSGNWWSCIVYRRGQKQLAHLFLKEAEHVLDLCLKEET